MPDFTMPYSATFGPLTIDCEIGYSVEPDEPRDTLLVDSVKVIQFAFMRSTEVRVFVEMNDSSLEPIAEAIADEIAVVRIDEIFKCCQGSYELYHQPKGRA